MFTHRRGHSLLLSTKGDYLVCRTELSPYVDRMTPRVDTEELIDAQEVADALGLAHRNSVSLYQRRYADMPRPVVERGGGRTKLWLRSEIEHWNGQRRTARERRQDR